MVVNVRDVNGLDTFDVPVNGLTDDTELTVVEERNVSRNVLQMYYVCEVSFDTVIF